MGAVAAEAKAFEAGLLFAKDVGVRDVITTTKVGYGDEI